jgi:hypothetical protein
MDVQFDGSDLLAEAAQLIQVNEKIENAAKIRLKEAAFTAKRNIQTRMPVDTGAAKSSWGAEGESGIFTFSSDGLEHTQGSELPYVNRLNEGWYSQAPAGFIDAEAEKAKTLMVNNLLSDLGQIL